MILSQTDNLKYPCKLNRLILAVQARYRLGQAAKGREQAICPICRGENKECRYFEPFEKDNLHSITFSTIEDEQSARFNRLMTVKKRLSGRTFTICDYDGEYTYDLGKSLLIARRYLNLAQPFEEMPLLKEIVNWGKSEKNEQPVLRIPFPTLALKVEAIPQLPDLDEAGRKLISVALREEMAQLNYRATWIWVPVLLQGNEIRDLPEEETSCDAFELLDKETFCRCQELLYQHYAVVEEEFLVKMNARNINERSYPCGDYQKSQSKIKNALKKAQEAIITELNTIKEGQSDERLLPDG
jgi:hypothetical protein